MHGRSDPSRALEKSMPVHLTFFSGRSWPGTSSPADRAVGEIPSLYTPTDDGGYRIPGASNVAAALVGEEPRRVSDDGSRRDRDRTCDQVRVKHPLCR